MKQYVDLTVKILKEGRIKRDRTGVGTISTFGAQSVFYMSDGFPLLTLKKTYPRGVFEELFWFLKGDSNIRYLNQKNVHIWDEWAYEKYKKNNSENILNENEFLKKIVEDEIFSKEWGDLGPIYGVQWINWNGINQIENLINRLKTVPDCRRLIVSAWNVSQISNMALAPCHVLFQFITEPLTLKERSDIFTKTFKDIANSINEEFYDKNYIPKYRLSLQMYQRSQDQFLGAPFNIASYSLLLHMVAQVVNMVPYKFVHTSGDAHLYLNHKEQVNEFLHRTHNNKDMEKIDYWDRIIEGENPDNLLGNFFGANLPEIKLNKNIKNIFDFTAEDIELVNYNPLPQIKAPVAI